MLKESIRCVRDYIKYWKALCEIKKNKNRVWAKIDKKQSLNVVFIIQYIPSWGKLEPIYERMKKDAGFNPYIVCVPLNIQNSKLIDEAENDTFIYFKEKNYDVINAYEGNGQWFDIKSLKPDYIFHSRPYNAFMPKCYVSDNLVKYALLCNVLYGASLTLNGRDVTLNKNYFKDVYMYFSFDKSEKQFYDKRFKRGINKGIQRSHPYGGTGLEQIIVLKNTYENKKYDKTILWTPRWSTDPYVGGSNFFQYKDTMLDLSTKYSNILFIFRPHPLMFSNFIKTGEMTEEEVIVFKERCSNQHNILLDEDKEYINTFWKSDILITDVSGILPEYFITEKPVLYCCPSIEFEYAEYAQEMIQNCYSIKSATDIYNVLEELLTGKDSKKNDRIKCIKKYFEDLNENSNNILNTLRKCE